MASRTRDILTRAACVASTAWLIAAPAAAAAPAVEVTRMVRLATSAAAPAPAVTARLDDLVEHTIEVRSTGESTVTITLDADECVAWLDGPPRDGASLPAGGVLRYGCTTVIGDHHAATTVATATATATGPTGVAVSASGTSTVHVDRTPPPAEVIDWSVAPTGDEPGAHAALPTSGDGGMTLARSSALVQARRCVQGVAPIEVVGGRIDFVQIFVDRRWRRTTLARGANRLRDMVNVRGMRAGSHHAVLVRVVYDDQTLAIHRGAFRICGARRADASAAASADVGLVVAL